MRDEGRSLGVGLQDQASNCLELLRSNDRGGERRRKRREESRQVRIMKTNASEPLKTCRKESRRHQNRVGLVTREKAQRAPADWLGGVRHKGGVSMIQALMRNVGTSHPDAKGEVQVGGPGEDQSTEAGWRDGATRSSEEAGESRWSEGVASSGLGGGSTSDGRSP